MTSILHHGGTFVNCGNPSTIFDDSRGFSSDKLHFTICFVDFCRFMAIDCSYFFLQIWRHYAKL